MIDFLYANGCSWTAGNGIDKDPILEPNANIHENINGHIQNKLAWPNRLSELLSCQVMNDGFGAGSNARMVRRTTEFLLKYPKEKLDTLLVVIGWSTIERNEIYSEEYKRWLNYNAAQVFSDQFINHKLTQAQIDLNKKIDKIQKQYVTWIESERANRDQYFQQMFLMKNLLENMKVKYLFFNSLPWSWEQPVKDYVKPFPTLSDKRILGYDDYETFSTFCAENNIPLSNCMHPMVEGHKLWAERLYKHLNTIYD